MMLNEGITEPTPAGLAGVLEKNNLRAAWLAVKANAGAAGVDGRDISQTEEHLREHWEGIEAKLRNGSYRPGAVRSVSIPKPNGGTRVLGIPNVQDRLIQQAIHQRLSERCEPDFSEHSYGFRPGRSAQDAVLAAQQFVKEGRHYVVDIDLKSFFDEINHDLLMHRLRQVVEDKVLRSLIGAYLKAPVQDEEGRNHKRHKGTPQGGPLSPLLANLYLDPLDKELESRGVSFVRYADDIAIFASSARAAQRILERTTEWIEKHLKVPVNREKSGSGPTDESALLGFRLHRNGDIRVAPRSIEKLKEEVRRKWDGQQSCTSKQLRDQWKSYISGWWNYFKIVTRRWEVNDISGWIRRHMRKCFWIRWKRPRGRLNALKRLGIRGRKLGMAYSGQGAWPIARHWIMHEALNNKTLSRYGLILPWTIAETGN